VRDGQVKGGARSSSEATVERVGKLMHVLHDKSAVEFYSYSRHVKIHDVHCVL
jgi:hypothetical protein